MGGSVATTTPATASIHVYDRPAGSLVGAHLASVLETSQLEVTDRSEPPATPLVEAQRAVTTPLARGVATNSADEFFQVSGAGANRAGTLVPESFDLSVAGQKFSVHPNATKHMAEYATGTGAGNVPMSSFAGSVETAVAQGLKPGRNFVQVGPWELGIDTNGNVIYHAVYRPGG